MFLAGFISGVILMGLVGGITVICCKQSGMDSRLEERDYEPHTDCLVPCRHDENINCPYAHRDGIGTDGCECDYYK